MYAGPPPAGGPSPFARYDSYGAIRGYDQLSLAVLRGDSYWENAYGRAAIQSNSEFGMGSEYHYLSFRRHGDRQPRPYEDHAGGWRLDHRQPG